MPYIIAGVCRRVNVDKKTRWTKKPPGDEVQGERGGYTKNHYSRILDIVQGPGDMVTLRFCCKRSDFQAGGGGHIWPGSVNQGRLPAREKPLNSPKPASRHAIFWDLADFALDKVGGWFSIARYALCQKNGQKKGPR